MCSSFYFLSICSVQCTRTASRLYLTILGPSNIIHVNLRSVITKGSAPTAELQRERHLLWPSST
ncbi:hypothetical protein BO71DRAFT_104276 [Aspergillus ellipticus CBS 707.79]|uniref:Uncharacterized protein n=1 Tax=Aspergillus ellipticus CBS 707.79 TaxID=1448320 RepID=A0A319CXR6_9EURO|nr:hypothetical protein BO71DRAFT_104276 [Aspergillus ellipticus CBS 707.79]